MAGQVTGIVGPNGAGKSTFLRTLFGDHAARRGSLRLGEEQYSPAHRRKWQARIGFMPQDNGSHGGLTALEVVLLGSIEHLSLRLNDVALRRAASVLDRLGMIDLSQRRVETLSGGQRQLVYFAQALMREPAVLLLDEPVSALDMRHQMLLMKQVREITRQRRIITIVVLHDLNLAASFADRLIMIHDGKAEVDGIPRDVLSSQLLERVYGVQTRLHYDPDGRPWVHVHDANEVHRAV
ncbi:ABC transporter ATP-binding protein [Mesorhizobium sp. WSM2239]|uniref:ABC transporter ATP-binding protein n=3 Tax=unclassified Mesorhizobium TaxID=325217 RepID=A0AAU8DH68_9HYPH